MVAPGRVIEGIIRDSQSGRPVSGVRVQSELSSAAVNSGHVVTATSDTQGRFRLSGMPRNLSKYSSSLPRPNPTRRSTN